jgi:hypothetical protein
MMLTWSVRIEDCTVQNDNPSQQYAIDSISLPHVLRLSWIHGRYDQAASCLFLEDEAVGLMITRGPYVSGLPP